MNSLAALDDLNVLDDLATRARRSLVVADDEGDEPRDGPLEHPETHVPAPTPQEASWRADSPSVGWQRLSPGRSQRLGERRSAWVRGLMDLTVRAPRWIAWGLTIAGLGGCWGVSYALGGAAAFPPEWFYLVVLLTGMRFGWRGALVTALASGLLAGPLLPASVSTGAAQPTSEWLIRAVFFVGLGQVVALLVSVFRQSLADEFVHPRAERDLRRGLDRGEFRVVYQPVVALDSERLVGVEALVRWDHPVRGVLEPSAFIADAEDSNAIVELGRFVLEETCRQIAAWKRTVLLGVAQFHVAVNVSPRQLQDPAFKAQVAAVLDKTGLDASWLHLEVTETAVIADLDFACVHLQAIRALGVRIAIDDFGTGYSSLGYLHKLPLDVVKIDRSFVASLGDPGRAGAIANLVAEVASRLDLTSVAEGVETRDHVVRLRALGCELAQGSYFGRPVDADVAHDLLASGSGPQAPGGERGLSPAESGRRRLGTPLRTPRHAGAGASGQAAPRSREGATPAL